MKEKKLPKYEIVREPSTGKVRKRKIDYDDFPPDDYDWIDGEEFNPKILRPVSCPYEFDNPEVYEKFSKPFKKATFSCQVDVELSLSAQQESEHKHGMIVDVDESLITCEADIEKWEFDMGLMFCGIYYNIEPKIVVTILKDEVIEDNEVRDFKEQIEKNADGKIDEIERENNNLRLKNFQRLHSQMTEYFEKYLANELGRVANRLFNEVSILEDKNKQREESIGIFLSDEDKELRKRLETPKGRTPIKFQQDYTQEKKKFINQCLKVLDKLAKKQRKLNKTELADSLFPRHSNPPQSLRRKFKALDLSFEEILEQFTEQKSS